MLWEEAERVAMGLVTTVNTGHVGNPQGDGGYQQGSRSVMKADLWSRAKAESRETSSIPQGN